MTDSLKSDSSGTGPLAPGTVLQGRYVIERMLGGGGMGVVYLARDRRLADRPCAVKEMVDQFIDPAQRREANEYFAREAETLARLRHPSIPAIIDQFDDQKRHYLVMEYVEGRNLEEELARLGHPMSEGQVLDIARQLCDVLAYLHGFNPPLVYRDMKPSNVMLTPDGRVILVDFGIARLFKGPGKGTMIGTLGFAPPEQYQGRIDPRSDIYSLGATLHYLLTGRDPEKYPPFSFPPVRELRPDVSRNLASAIDKALSYNLEDRPQTIQEFRDMMLYGEGLAGGDESAPVTPRGGTAGLRLRSPETKKGRTRELPRRSRFSRALGLVALTLVLGTVAFGATYVYYDPVLQERLGVKQWMDALPWRREQRLEAARAHPLVLDSLTLELSTRNGDAKSPPKTAFLDTELANDPYLRWTATMTNQLYGLEGKSERVVARFYDPNGLQIAESESTRFVGREEAKPSFSGVALLPDLSASPHGKYRVALFLDGDKPLGTSTFTVAEDVEAKRRAALAQAEEERKRREAERKAEEARRQEERRLAMLEKARRNPLKLRAIKFFNATKSGTPLSGPTDSFDVRKVLFVAWKAVFQNRLYHLDVGHYRVDAVYIAPDGRTLGSVSDEKSVSDETREVTFSARIGNAAGGAFLPGTYTVKFYLNGQYLTEKTFEVTGVGGLAGGGGGNRASPSNAVSRFDTPVVASGKLEGLGGTNEITMEMRLRPQPNSFLRGELVIHKPGYGLTPLNGFVRGNHLEFEVPYGGNVIYFEGIRSGTRLSGVFQVQPSGEHGKWSAKID